MPADHTRRQLLAAVGAGAGVAVVGRAGATRGDCETLETLRDRRAAKRERRDVLTAEADTLTDRVTTLEEEIERARERYRAERHWADEATRETALEIGLELRESVVAIEVISDVASASGTGWFLEEDLVVTNSHVVSDAAGADEFYGWTVDGERFDLEYVNRVEGLSPDIGLARTDFSGTPVTTGDSTELDDDTDLLAVGHPGSYGNWQITLGEFTERRDRYETDELVTTVPSLQGSSGSPTATLDGEVVAMLKGADGFPTLDGAPDPVDPRPQTLPFAEKENVLHDPIEAVVDRVEGWT